MVSTPFDGRTRSVYLSASVVSQVALRVSSLVLLLIPTRSHPTQEEFCSLYLPSLMRTTINLNSGRLFRIYMAIAVWAMAGGGDAVVACRFTREQPELVLAYYQLLSRALVDLTQERGGLVVSSRAG